MKKKTTIVFIVGPTASGKSLLAVALAKRLRGEIISADSMLVYKGMDIGTAKPNLRERRKIPHHGIDLIPPTKSFSVFSFHQFATKKVRDIIKRGKLPIIAGGTGFYVRALLEGFVKQPAANSEIREKLEQEAGEKGLAVLYGRLLRVDPERARQIGPKNQRRIIRALEIYELSGKMPSKLSQRLPGLSDLGCRPLVIGLHRDRRSLYEKIGKRVDRMFRKGLIREVKQLAKKGFSETALQGVGYKEVLAGLQSGSLKTNGDEVREKIKKSTRHFAKRQWTWFKREKGIRWVWWPEGRSVKEMTDFLVRYFDLT